MRSESKTIDRPATLAASDASGSAVTSANEGVRAAPGTISAGATAVVSTLRRYPDLALVAALLLLTATFSRSFSQAVSIGPIYVTEVVMVLAGAIAIPRLGVGASWRVLNRLPLPALILIWVVGAIATLRGLNDFGLSMVVNDIGLVDYTLLLPLLALVVVDRERHEAMFSVLVACGFAGIGAFLVTYSASQITSTPDALIKLQGFSAGLYMSLAVAWIAARVANGIATSRWLMALRSDRARADGPHGAAERVGGRDRLAGRRRRAGATRAANPCRAGRRRGPAARLPRRIWSAGGTGGYRQRGHG